MANGILDDLPPEGEPDLQDFQWLDLRNAVEREPQELDFVLPGLKAGTVGALVSPGGGSKTMLALQAAVTVAGGPDMLRFSGIDGGWRREAGRVVYLSAEDPPDVLHRRLHAIGARLKRRAEREAVYENLAIAPLVGRGADVMAPEWRRWVDRVSVDARLVVIDTLRRFHQLDENSGGAMAGLLGYLESICRERATTVLFLHHASKSGALNASDAQQASRGSSVLTDNARFQANMIGMNDEQAKRFGVHEDRRRDFVRLVFTKLNYSAPLPDQWFRRAEGGVLEPATLKARKGAAMPERGGSAGDEDDDERW